MWPVHVLPILHLRKTLCWQEVRKPLQLEHFINHNCSRQPQALPYTFLYDNKNKTSVHFFLFTGRPVTMSSQYPCYRGFCFPGSKAVDGIFLPAAGEHEYTSIAHTKREVNSYIQIDLEDNHCISAVRVWNRGVGLGKWIN